MQTQTSQLIHVMRDVTGLMVPYGTEITLAEGSFVTLTQNMGGAFTVIANGNMIRIDGEDGDALGKEPEVIHYDPPTDNTVSEEDVWRTLGTIYDPEIPVSIVELGLIYGCDVIPQDNGENIINIQMTLTAPGCGMGPVLVEEARLRLLKVPNVHQVTVDLVFEPPWAQHMMSDAAKLELGVFY